MIRIAAPTNPQDDVSDQVIASTAQHRETIIPASVLEECSSFHLQHNRNRRSCRQRKRYIFHSKKAALWTALHTFDVRFLMYRLHEERHRLRLFLLCAGLARVRQPFPHCVKRGLGAVGQMQFAEDAAHMGTYSRLADSDAVSNLLVAQTLGN